MLLCVTPPIEAVLRRLLLGRDFRREKNATGIFFTCNSWRANQFSIGELMLLCAGRLPTSAYQRTGEYMVGVA